MRGCERILDATRCKIDAQFKSTKFSRSRKLRIIYSVKMNLDDVANKGADKQTKKKTKLKNNFCKLIPNRKISQEKN